MTCWNRCKSEGILCVWEGDRNNYVGTPAMCVNQFWSSTAACHPAVGLGCSFGTGKFT